MLERRREKRPDFVEVETPGEGGLSALSRPTASANGGHCGDKSERGKNLFIGSLVFPLFHSFASPQQRESLNLLSVSSVYSPLQLQILNYARNSLLPFEFPSLGAPFRSNGYGSGCIDKKRRS